MAAMVRSRLMETMDIYKHSGFPWLHEWLEDMLTTNTLMKIPVLGQILAPAVWLYVFLFILAYIFTFGKFRHFIPMSFIGGFYITVLLGPVVLMRYVYPIMLCMMIYLFRYSDRFYFRLKSKFKKI